VVLQTLPNLLGATLSYAQTVLIGEYERLVALCHLLKFLGTNFAKGALLGSCLTLVNVTTYGTTEFFHSSNCVFDLLLFNCLVFV
jgi:hypothetical protein